MLIITPPIIDNTVTQVKHEEFYQQSMISTCLGNVYHALPEEFGFSSWVKDHCIFSTDLSLGASAGQDNSTWEEGVLSEFDLVVDVGFNKTIKVKSKIKAVTKYTPNIVID
jgi:hypothetical protein